MKGIVLILIWVAAVSLTAFAQQEGTGGVRDIASMIEPGPNRTGPDLFSPEDPCGRSGTGFIPQLLFEGSGVVKDLDKTDTGVVQYGKVNGDKNIYWLHGLNGNFDSWNPVAMATQYGSPEMDYPARRANSINFSAFGGQAYSENYGISVAAMNVASQADQLVYTHTPNDFIVAHSQGGLVAREWLRKMEKEPNIYASHARGLVTFGTPHGGAQVINQCRPEMGNKASQFLKEACMKLGNAMITPALNSSFITRIAISEGLKNKLLGYGCSGLVNSVISLAVDQFLKETTKDFYVGAPFLNGYTSSSTGKHIEGLNEHQLNIPVIQFYAVEREPVLWRYLSSFKKMGEDHIQNGSAIFSYDDDNAMIHAINRQLSDLNAKIINEHSKLTERSAKLFHRIVKGGIGINTLGYIEENIRAYEGAFGWFMNANEYYETEILGLREIIETRYFCVTETWESCTGLFYAMPSTKLFYSAKRTEIKEKGGCPAIKGSTVERKSVEGVSCSCDKTEIQSVKVQYVYAFKPNDGLVSMESQAASLNVHPDHSYFRIHMGASNHSQMLNDSKTRYCLLNTLDGNFGKFFKTETR